MTTLVTQALQEAVQASWLSVQQKHLGGEEAAKSQEAELRAHRYLWCLLTLVLRNPPTGQESLPGREGALPRLAVLRGRLQQLELGNVE